MEIRPGRWNEAQFLPGSDCIDTAIWMHYMDANGWRRNLTATTQECWEQYWTSPGDNTPQDANCTPTCLPSRKLYRLDEPDTPDTAGEARTSSKVTYSYGPPHMAKQKQDGQLELTYSSYVRTQDVTQKTCRRRWMIGRSGERWSRISVLAARHDDDDIYKIRHID